ANAGRSLTWIRASCSGSPNRWTHGCRRPNSEEMVHESRVSPDPGTQQRRHVMRKRMMLMLAAVALFIGAIGSFKFLQIRAAIAPAAGEAGRCPGRVRPGGGRGS